MVGAERETYPILMLSSVALQETGGIVSGMGRFVGSVISAPGEIAEGMAEGIETGKPISKAISSIGIVFEDIGLGIGLLMSSMIKSGSIVVHNATQGVAEIVPMLKDAGDMLGIVVVGFAEGASAFITTASGAMSVFGRGASEGVSPGIYAEMLYLETETYRLGYDAGQKFGNDVLDMIRKALEDKNKVPTSAEIERVAMDRTMLLAPGEKSSFVKGYKEVLQGVITPIGEIQETPELLMLTPKEMERASRVMPGHKIGASSSEMKARFQKARRVTERRQENIDEIMRLSARTGLMLGKITAAIIPG